MKDEPSRREEMDKKSYKQLLWNNPIGKSNREAEPDPMAMDSYSF